MAPSAAPDLYTLLSRNANDTELWRSQASTLLAKGDAQRSKLLLETLLHAAPEDVSAHLLLTDACLGLGPGCYAQALTTARYVRPHE